MSFLIVGDDGQTINFEVDSETYPGERYEVHMERSTGNLYCSCPSAVFGKKVGHLLHPQDGCKHIRAWHEQKEAAI